MKLSVELGLALLGGLVTILTLFGKYLTGLLSKKKEDTEWQFKIKILEGKVKELEEEIHGNILTKIEKIAILEERIRAIRNE